jgi:hypothetical protein
MTIALTPNPLILATAPQALTINLSPGAGTSPVNVNLTGFDATVVSLSSNSIQISADSSSANVTVTPLALGNTSITASAAGYQTGSASVSVVTPAIAVTFNNNASSVPVTQTIGGTITLSAAAPPGGTSVSLVDVQDYDAGQTPGLVTFNPTSVVISPGSTTGTFTMTGAAVGPVEILPGAPGYPRVNFIPFNVTNNVALSLPCPAVAAGDVNAPFTSQVSAVGGVTPYIYSVVGTLPNGLALNPSTGAITGIPTTPGSFSIKVTDTAGSSAASCTFTISSALSLPCPATTSGQVNVSFSSQTSALGGVMP